MKRPCLPLPAVQAPTTKILPTKCLNIAEPRIFCPPKITRYMVPLRFLPLLNFYSGHTDRDKAPVPTHTSGTPPMTTPVNGMLPTQYTVFHLYSSSRQVIQMCQSVARSIRALPPPSVLRKCKVCMVSILRKLA